MSRFEIRKKEQSMIGNDFLQLLDNETGQSATIYNQGSSLQELVFNYGGELVNVVYGHQDYADFLAGLPRLDLPRIDPFTTFSSSHMMTVSTLEYNQEIGRYAESQRLMRSNPAWAGAAFLDLANRTYKGQGVIIHPETGAVVKTMNFPINHESSNSFIHGNGMFRNAFVCHIESNDDYALVTMKQLVGVDLEDFPKGVFNFTTYKLTPARLIESGVVWNLGEEFVPVTQGRHSSYRIGKEGIEDHELQICSTGALEVDGAKNPTGRILPDLYRGKSYSIHHLADEALDTTYLLMPGAPILLINKARNYGLSLEATDNETRMATCWTHELPEEVAGDYHRQFAAIEFLAAGHSAMLSLPLQLEQRIIPKELQQRVLAPNEALHYGRSFSPVVYK